MRTYLFNIENGDKIYEIIVKRIVWEPDPTFSPKQLEQPKSFNIDTTGLQVSEKVLKTMEELKQWEKIYWCVSPDTYTARIMLYVSANRPTPIFQSSNTFRIKQFIANLENRFMSPKIREELIRHFCKFKRTYWGFTKLARIWKVRRIPVRIQTDLYMNDLDTKHRNTFQLVHTNGIYLFSLQNLVRIVVDAITHQSGMFIEPLPIKNPYTNSLLSKCDLFNIYFSLRYYHIRIHEMMERFFRCEFNIFEFHRKYVTELRDFGIEQYVKNANTNDLAQDLDDMLRVHKMTNKIIIYPGFPKKQLVDTMRPMLRLYLLERYSFSSVTRKYSAKQLNLELRKFNKKNPLYGGQINTDTNESTYITDTNPYSSYCVSKYMQTHIYNEDTFEKYIETGDNIETYLEAPSNTFEDEDEGTTAIFNEIFNDYYVLINNNATATTTTTANATTTVSATMNTNEGDTAEDTPDQQRSNQIQENGLAILERIGLMNRQMAFNRNIELINNFITQNVTTENQNDADAEEEEEEVINNTEEEEESVSSEFDWDDYDDEEDSVS